MIAEFFLTVLYTQITVAVPGAAAKGLLWTDDHVAQGFAWSPGFVSFGLPDHDGRVRVVVLRPEAFRVTPQSLWAVQTPLDVPGSPVEIGSIVTEHAVSLPPGRYNLVFEARSPQQGEAPDVAYVVHLHFIGRASPSSGRATS